MRIALLLTTLFYTIPVWGQFSFSNRTNLLANQNLRSGAPIAVADMNGDGLDDIIRLDGTEDLFIDYQTGSGMSFSGFSFGPTFGSQWSICIADVDGNGYNDILTGGAYNGLKLLRANAGGTNYTLDIINILPIFLQGSNFADINNDGHIDIFACHDDGLSHPYRNDGFGNFIYDTDLINPVSTVPSDNSGNYGSVWTDYDNDGDIDLYISKCRLGVSNPNDGRRLNLLFENDGNGNYQDVASSSGLLPMGQSWATDFADIDNDGDMDAFVLNHDILSGLYENNGFGLFTNITAQSGLSSDLLTAGLGIQVKFADFDNDNFIDLLITSNGPTHLLFRNNGNTTFSNLTATIPTLGNRIHSVATGDLNDDGFVDLVAGFGSGFNSPSFTNDQLYFNNGNGNNYLKVALQGTTSNPNGIGARLELYGLWGVQIREVRSGESYGIMTSMTQHFGLSTIPFIDSLIVRWPSGVVDRVLSPAINQTLNVVEGSNCVPTLSFDVGVNDLTAIFIDETTIGATQWLWDFGDGQSSTEQNPTYTYQAAGIYQVCLNVSGFCGSGQVCQSVNVSCQQPQAVFGSMADGLTVNFSDNSLNNPTQWLWTFGDGSSSPEQHPVHSFPTEGTYFVCLQVGNSCGTTQFCDNVTVGCEDTEADFNYEANELAVTFTDASMGGVNTWAWDFGDGTSSDQQNPEHTFPNAGTFTVCLQINSSCGQEISCQTVMVSCPLPTVGFEYASQQLMVAFASDVDDEVLSYTWNFGDGAQSDQANPLHEYSEAGSYFVCLDATTICGTTQVCQQINLTCLAPQAAFIHSSNDLQISFTDASSNFPEGWTWTFGDGNSATSQNPAYEYSQPGTYQVCLQVTNICGQNQVCEMITVSCSNPEANFTNQTSELTLTLQDISTNQPDQWLWTFGDGSSSFVQNPQHTYTEPGNYLVCLTAFNSCGSDQNCQTLALSCTGPTAQFDIQTDQLTLNFSDNSSNNPENWMWTFGDGQTSTAQNPSHTFALPGTYSVCLEVGNVCGTDQVCQSVQISCAAPEAGFNFTTNELTASFTDQTSGGGNQWVWTFGDGNTSTNQNPQHAYTAPGTYEVCLQVSSVCGSDQICTNVLVNCSAPQAGFSFGTEGLLVSFDDQSTNGPSSWTWTFGDGNGSNEANPVYEYDLPGVYEVCLEVESVCGATQTCLLIEVTCAAPNASFSFTQDELTFVFMDQSTNEPTEWLWDFGNGQSSTEANPEITFDAPGEYEVCLTASSICGSNQTCQTLNVNCAAPLAGFSFTSDELTLVFQDFSQNEPTEWLWTFGDGSSSTLQEPTHTYAEPGVYVICLQVTSICGTHQNCLEVNVVCNAPQANFDTQADELSINFIDISSNTPTEWFWEFGDGNTSMEQNPTHEYELPGEYSVCLTVSSVCGTTERCESLAVSCLAPESNFSTSADNLNVSFADASTNNPTEWLWAFGDGATSTEQNPSHNYEEPGIYEVCLTVTSICGSSSNCLEVVVSCAPPEAAFSVSSNGLTQIFIDASINNPTQWFWDFGDGSTSVVQTPIHTYAEASNYTICLIASSICGSDTICQILNIVTDIDEEDPNKITLHLSPNPSRDILQLQLKFAPQGVSRIHLWNVAGQRLDSQVWEITGAENTKLLNVEELPPGLYLLQLETDAGLLTRRFVKQ